MSHQDTPPVTRYEVRRECLVGDPDRVQGTLDVVGAVGETVGPYAAVMGRRARYLKAVVWREREGRKE